LEIPLIVAGDLHDTKANLRGECVNAMVQTFSKDNPLKYILVGNHDKINEKSEEHSLNFLENPSIVIDRPYYDADMNLHLLPYFSDPNELRRYLSTLPRENTETVIMHQGLSGSNMGDYIQDRSAITPGGVAGLRVISGHYHNRQTIELPDSGKWDYIGNPFSLSFGEANDPPKGFQVLYSDGSLEFIPTNLRKHIIIDIKVGDLDHPDMWQYDCKPGDLLWVKVHGDKEYLNLSKDQIAKAMEIEPNFKLTFHPTEQESQVLQHKNLTQHELLDSVIDNLTNTSDECKVRLRDEWRRLCE
jgi:DNA repair exonuclease SbcCD nuclease subunit